MKKDSKGEKKHDTKAESKSNKEIRQDKIREGANDFSVRFEEVMRELANG